MTPSLSSGTTLLAMAMGGDEAAHLAAGALLEAELLDQPRFGLDFFSEWVSPRRLAAQTPAGSVQFADADGVFAPVAIAQATLHLVEAARCHGIAIVFLKGVLGFGRLAPFVRYLADQGLVGFAGAQGPAFVAPDGGKAPVIGTNPFALGMGLGADRIVIDTATSGTTMAAIKGARATGTFLPAGIAIDEQGQPTIDPHAVAALLPRGGRIGSLLGLVIELLAGVLGNARADSGSRGVFVCAIDPGSDHDTQAWAALQKLKAEWIAAEGHWPAGRSLASDTQLPPHIRSRLEAALAHIHSKERAA